MKRILLITPPLVQLNAPYPATAVLCASLRAAGFSADQFDLSLALALRLFSAKGLSSVEAAMRRARRPVAGASARHFLRHADVYRQTVDPVITFLQGRSPALAHRIVGRAFLPEGPRFADLRGADDALFELFGSLGVADRAKHLASLYLDDLADAVRQGVDPHFGFSRYAERLAASAPAYAPLRRALDARPTLVDAMLDTLADEVLTRFRPALLGLTVPFPGTLYGALRVARRARAMMPGTHVVLGGGYVNTELRELDEPRLFDDIDSVCLDDGGEPLVRLAARVCRGSRRPLVRTVVREPAASPTGRVIVPAPVSPSTSGARPARPGTPAQRPFLAPVFDGLPLDDYVSLLELPNPMHRLWSDGCWLKVPLVHGCYWARCRFCDTSLDAISCYRAPRPQEVAAALFELRRQTGRSGFHFTDEALPPGFLRQLAAHLEAGEAPLAWWGNVRFEPVFTSTLARALARAGCVAVTGGLECAHDRLLALMQKGITLRGAARACRALSGAGILVHAYLMYGFPTQTVQETVDALEYLRQLFAAGAVQSAYWHRFALTCHSPIAANPGAFGLRLVRERRRAHRFARNELRYREASAPDIERLGAALRRATYNFMLGHGWDEPVTRWFDRPVPKPSLRRDFVQRA